MAQTATLVAGAARQGTQAGLRAGVALGWWSDEEGRVLSRAASLCREVQMATRLLVGDGALDPGTLGAGARAFVLRETGCANIPALVDALAARSDAAASVIENALAHARSRQEDGP